MMPGPQSEGGCTDECDRSTFYGRALDLAIARQRWNERMAAESADSEDGRTYRQRAKRHSDARQAILRKAPADVLEDLVSTRPEFEDEVFEALNK
jgi:hypothetical protein